MADTKITALTALTGADPANDVIPIVDVSDTTMAASGTTKKISVNNILGASGTATLASATITGNLTVNGSYISCGNNSYIRTDAANLFSIQTGSGGFRIMNAGNSALFYGIDSASTSTWYDGAGGTRMTLNSTGLGVGASPTNKLTIGTGAYAAGTLSGTSSLYSTVAQGLVVLADGLFVGTRTGGDRFTLDTSGNVGIGVTPSAWLSGYKALQINATTNLFGTGTASWLTNNWTVNAAGSNTYQLGSATAATAYFQGSGSHYWFNAVAGTGTISAPVQAMTLDASGNLSVGTTNAGSVFGSVRSGFVATGANGAIGAKVDDTGRACLIAWNADTSGDNSFIQFFTEASITSRGSISYNRAGGLVAYNTTSDYRAKDIIGPVSNSGSLIDSLKVYVGKMKGATIERPMLIAHEAQEVAPYAVTGTKDEVDADGKPKYQQMDASALVPLLIAEIQSLRARVQTLETR